MGGIFARLAWMLVIFLAGALGVAQAIDTRPAPKAVTPFTSFNFGDVYTGEVISQIFVIKNEGDSELRITDLKAG
ncbi:MAG TPA: hypothetical protein VKF81_07035 [Blastocatellia bacterium]|nr:hypothetical protein [Blastocatellia bacterium]